MPRGFALKIAGPSSCRIQARLGAGSVSFGALQVSGRVSFPGRRIRGGRRHSIFRMMEIPPTDYRSPFALPMITSPWGEAEAETYARIPAGAGRGKSGSRGFNLPLGWARRRWFIGRGRARPWITAGARDRPDDNITRYNAACTYGLLGQKDRALDPFSGTRSWVQERSMPAPTKFCASGTIQPIRGPSGPEPRYRRLVEERRGGNWEGRSAGRKGRSPYLDARAPGSGLSTCPPIISQKYQHPGRLQADTMIVRAWVVSLAILTGSICRLVSRRFVGTERSRCSQIRFQNVWAPAWTVDLPRLDETVAVIERSRSRDHRRAGEVVPADPDKPPRSASPPTTAAP